MSPQRTLIVASIACAVIWTAGMLWSNAPTFAGAIIFVFGGALAGTGWYFGMRWWMNRFIRQSPQHRLVEASIAFAAIWTAGMLWWNAPTFAGAIILMFSGALVGILYYFGVRWWMNKVARQ